MQFILGNGPFEAWSPDDFLNLAGTAGYSGILVHGPYGLPEVGPWGAWLQTPALIQAACALAKVSIAGLHLGPIDAHNSRSATALRGRIERGLTIARRANCPTVLLGGDGPTHAAAANVVAHSLEAIAATLSVAAEANIQILLGPGGAIRDNKMLWNLHDALSSPTIGLWLDPLAARIFGEPPTISIKRLARGLRWVSLRDGAIDERDGNVNSAELGNGDADAAMSLNLLRGLAFDRSIAVDYPASAASLPLLDEMPKRALEWIKGELAKAPVQLSAYKGDKNAPKFRAPVRDLTAAKPVPAAAEIA